MSTSKKTEADNDIIIAVHNQIEDLEPARFKQINIDSIVTGLTNAQLLLDGNKADIPNVIMAKALTVATDIQSGKKEFNDFGFLIGNLNSLLQIFQENGNTKISEIISGIISEVNRVLQNRPDVEAIMNDLETIKNLRGGPADAIAFHDFHVLQIAYKNIWKHAFDQNLQSMVEQVFMEHMKVYDEAGIKHPPYDAIDDINDLENFIRNVGGDAASLVPIMDPSIGVAFPGAAQVWNLLSGGQRFVLFLSANLFNKPGATSAEKDYAMKVGLDAISAPAGPAGRLSKLIYEIGLALN
ncbi:MAG TPA: hypothetical protein VGD22_18330, partial [Sphingobacteriaceae bacterium]